MAKHHFNTIVHRLKKWGNLDLNQGPAGYESVRNPLITIISNS